MNKTSTPDSLFSSLNNKENDELGELISMLKQNEQDFTKVFNYLDKLKCDVSDESVKKIMEFADEYRLKTTQKERV